MGNEQWLYRTIKYVIEDGGQGRGYLLDTIRRVWKDASKRKERLIGGISLEDKKEIVQLQSADKLINLCCKSIAGFIENKKSEEEIVGDLIKSKSYAVYELTKDYVKKNMSK